MVVVISCTSTTPGGIFTSIGITDIGNTKVGLGLSAFDVDKSVFYDVVYADGVQMMMTVKLGTMAL